MVLVVFAIRTYKHARMDSAFYEKRTKIVSKGEFRKFLDVRLLIQFDDLFVEVLFAHRFIFATLCEMFLLKNISYGYFTHTLFLFQKYGNTSKSFTE